MDDSHAAVRPGVDFDGQHSAAAIGGLILPDGVAFTDKVKLVRKGN